MLASLPTSTVAPDFAIIGYYLYLGAIYANPFNPLIPESQHSNLKHDDATAGPGWPHSQQTTDLFNSGGSAFSA